jgi:hypothetical protein
MAEIKKKSVTKIAKKPPIQSIKSVQMDLFSNFLSNDVSEVSNTVEYWERIPKYFLSTKEQDKLRTADGLAQFYNYEYSIKNIHGDVLPYKVRIQQPPSCA